ncbi:MAG: hypothetical protein E6R03_15430 [Hyphomicrobiaceae bacterium]|nr:MAG: hypothetical protein E6R03_15430 [Hyphomicrobiaceae bacterium]
MAKPAELKAIKERFLANAEALWDAHDTRINRVLGESTTSSLTVSFSCRIDESQLPIKATTRIKFAAKATSDSVESEIDPPEQGKLPLSEEPTPPRKEKTACKPKRAKKKKAAPEPEPETSAPSGESD